MSDLIDRQPEKRTEERTETHACDLISRQAALDALNRIEISRNASWYEFYQKAITAVGTLPSTCRLLEDGTLIVKVPNLSAVHRVIVDAEDSHYCKTFYQDGDGDE